MENEFEIGKPIPDWDLVAVKEDVAVPNLADYKGKPLIVLFYSLTCPGCIGRAIPFANRIVYENGDAINVIGINTHFEGPESTNEQLIKAEEDLHIRFPYFRDAGFASTFHTYRGVGTPHWIVIDENGVVLDSIFGSEPNRALLKLDYIIDELKVK